MQIRKLNMLRGLAALIVAISHYSNVTHFLGGALGGGAGYIGGMILFPLSGFLLAYLYLEKEFDQNNVIGYVVARGARVMPLFVVIVLVSYLLHRSGITGILYEIPTVKIALANLLLFSGTAVMWTIPTEIHYYAIFVLLWFLYSRKKENLFLALAAIFVALFFIDFPLPSWKIFGLPFQLAILGFLPYFMMGTALGALYRLWEAPQHLKKNAYAWILVLIPLILPNIFSMIFGFRHEIWQDVGVMLVITAVFFTVLFLVPDDNLFLSNRVGDFLGKISYSIYLFHYPALGWMVGRATARPNAYFLPYLAIVIALSFLSYTLIENPARNFLRRWLTPKPKPLPDKTPEALPASE
ncbi:MAG: acyltransferase [Chloroflexota bacterium]